MPKTYTLPLADALIRQITDIGNYLTREYPDAWHNAHNGDPISGTEFVRRWALACRNAGIDAGCNGKRGGTDLSQDVLTLGVDKAGAKDTSNTFAWIVIADVIGGAGGPNPSIGWNDVSAASPGRYIDPWLEPSEIPGTPPGPPIDPIDPPINPNPPPVGGGDTNAQFAVLNQKLDQLLAGQEAAKAQQAADTDQIGKWMVEQAQGVVNALTNEIQGLGDFKCNFRSPFRGMDATVAEVADMAANAADAALQGATVPDTPEAVAPPPAPAKKSKK